MSDSGLTWIKREVQRAIDESLDRKGMIVGLPKTTLSTDKVQYLLRATDQLERELAAERERSKRLEDALRGLEPYLDAIVCYASTCDEHEPNRLVRAARAALEAEK